MRTLAIGITPLSCCCGGGSSTSPAIRLSGLGVFQEDIAAGAALGTLSVVNVTGTPTYTLTDNDGLRVALTGANLTRGATAWDYETHPIITATISVSGVTPSIAPRTFLLFATNVLEVTLAALGLSPSTILEGSPAGTVVGAITGVTGGSSLALTDDGGGRFAISGTNLVTTAIPTDYESSTLHAITIRETHPDAAPRDTALAVTVTDVLEITLAPLTLSANTILEGSAAGTMVGSIVGQTSGSTLELFDDAGDRFAFGAAADPTLALDLDFTTGTLDSKVTFTRSTTATYVNASGLVASSAINAARFDYNPSTLAARGLLLEEQRTNILLYSEQFDAGANWIGAGVTYLANQATAPDGTMAADLVTLVPGGLAYQGVTYIGLVPQTFSLYIKKGTAAWAFLRPQDSASPYVWFNLTTGAVGTMQAGITSASTVDVGNGWWRIIATKTVDGGGYFVFGLSDTDNSTTSAGNLTAYAWGAQVEAGAFATSYIPTTTAAVTRAADVAVMTGTNFSSWYNASTGTFVVEGQGARNDYAQILSAPTVVQVIVGRSSSSPNIVYTEAGLTHTITTGGFSFNTSPYKIGLAYAAGSRALTANGSAPATDAATNPTYTDMSLGNRAGSYFISGTIKRLSFYNVRKTNAELQALTT